MFDLVPASHPALRTVSREVDPGEIPQLRKDLYWLQKLMKALRGVGLAANQIGDTRRYFAWDLGLCINPRVTTESVLQTQESEGCLSFPGLHATVVRPAQIIVYFLDERGKVIERGYDGRYARIFQHELDHLNGICIDQPNTKTTGNAT